MAYNLPWLSNAAAGGSRLETDVWPNGTVTAASNSRDDVNTAITNATDGQIVVIPDGSVTWSSGITTTKQILIRAQNYTVTSGGTGTRNLTITNNSSSPLIQMTPGSTYHIGVAGIKFVEGSTSTNMIRFNSSSSTKVPLLSDCSFSFTGSRSGNAGDVAVLTWYSQGGVLWNMHWVVTSGSGGGSGASFHMIQPRAWTTASTLGSADTNGTINTYQEDSYAFNCSQFPDIDDNARYVCRYSTLDGSWGTSHGLTSTWGGRHVEYYENTFDVSDTTRNHIGRYYWVRAGTGVFHNNVVNNADPQEYGNVSLCVMGEDGVGHGSYLVDRQPGCGHNGSAYVSDPIYMYANTGARAYSSWIQTGWSDVVQADRDYFPADGGSNPGTKPGYSPYDTYPHPLRYTKVV